MLTSLVLDSFKNHTDRSFSWGEKNILAGPNGSGKTNVLEAIYLFVNAIPPQERVFLQLVPTDSGMLSMGGEFIRNSLPYSGRIGYTKEEGKIHFLSQENTVTRSRHLELMPIRAVLFTPMEMNILYLGPSLRRDFLDEALLLAYPEFTKIRREYGLALKNRNSLLKQIREGVSDRGTLDLWDSLFTERAKAYYLYRKELIDFIENRIGSVEVLLEGKYKLSFQYTTKADFSDMESSMLQYLQKNRERDIVTGYTYIGPHLDDFQCMISGEIPSNSYLSRGENKTILIGLKFILIEFIEKSSKKETILLLDDLFSELDSEHIESLLKHAGSRQLFITAQNVPDFLIGKRGFSFYEI
ncbi:MAG: DNA replication and repair protein RecF [Candidatus Gracilibacteria bacterium]|nr:DNA replication and repair protein RecF [Candidatus Gracilibacteria bacterium]